MRFFTVVILAGLLMGCAPKVVPIAEESMNECERLVKMTERTYLDKSVDEVLEAATRLFRLADGGYTVTRTSDGLIAQRNWLALAPSAESSADGTDMWQIIIKNVDVCTGGYRAGIVEAVKGDPANEIRGATDVCGASVPGVKIAVYLTPEIHGQGLAATECFASPVFRPAVSKFVVAPAVYDLFFLRLDHLLGKTPHWVSCPGYSEYIRNNVHYRDQFSMLNFRGSLDGLCSQAKDLAP